MVSGAVAIFQGATACHGTTRHNNERRAGSEAHISFAVQTPAAALRLDKAGQGEERRRMQRNMVENGLRDAGGDQWREAVWVPVWHFGGAKSPNGHLEYSEELMTPLKWKKIILYDVLTGCPLVFYDMEGGLADEGVREFTRGQFSFLHEEWQFKLHRGASESGASGSLHLDPQGQQRMEMVGIHARGYNVHKPPDRKRPGLAVANARGDLDAYVVHFDEPEQFSTPGVKWLWNYVSERMHALLPSASKEMVRLLRAAGVRDRLYTEMARSVTSDDLLVNNVGISAGFQSPPHHDGRDVGWTFAFTCK
jgi:hypothetical protein